MSILRTPEARFENLKDFNFEPNYLELSYKSETMRMHYLDENKDSDDVVLLLHGEPTWCYLYNENPKRISF